MGWHNIGRVARFTAALLFLGLTIGIDSALASGGGGGAGAGGRAPGLASEAITGYWSGESEVYVFDVMAGDAYASLEGAF